MARIILASQSPRRKELLQWIVGSFDVIPSCFDEASVTETDPFRLVTALAQGKAEAIVCLPEQTVIGCDTVVAMDGQIFGKPADREQARAMMHRFSGREHSVVTGVCIHSREAVECFTCETLVRFYSLTEDEIESYIRTEEPYDKAGGYGIQERGGLFVEGIQGDYNNVVGLPLAQLYRALRKRGLLSVTADNHILSD